MRLFGLNSGAIMQAKMGWWGGVLHCGREQVQQVSPETGVQLLIPINERHQGTLLTGHQSYLNPQSLSWFA